jgi:hypothetical protein
MKKILLSFLAILIFLFSFAPYFKVSAAASVPTSASQSSSEGTWYSQNFNQWFSKVYGSNSQPNEIFGERYTAAQVEWVIYGLFAFVLNKTTGDPYTTNCLLNNDINDCLDRVKDFFGSLSKLASNNSTSNNKSLASLVFAERPFSGIAYLKSIGKKLKIIPEAQAQTTPGYGFEALNPIRKLWRATRDFSYGLLVLIVIILAFMIMFRTKISPQTVITIQSVLPKIILAIIFVTFSYAIAGFLIDLVYVVIGIISYFFSLIESTQTSIFTTMTTGLPVVGGGFLGLMLIYFVLFFWTLLFVLFASGSLGIATIFLGPILALIWLLLIIIAAIVLLFLTFKIFWLLLKTLAQTYLLVIFGPLQIILGAAAPAIPSLGAGAWIKSLISNLVVYPVVGSLFVLSQIFLGFSVQLAWGNLLGGQIITTLFSNLGIPLSLVKGGWNPPLTLGESYLPLMFLAVSFVIMTIIPKTAELIQSVIQSKPFAFGTAIGEAFAPAATYGYTSLDMLQKGRVPFPFNKVFGDTHSSIGLKSLAAGLEYQLQQGAKRK